VEGVHLQRLLGKSGHGARVVAGMDAGIRAGIRAEMEAETDVEMEARDVGWDSSRLAYSSDPVHHGYQLFRVVREMELIGNNEVSSMSGHAIGRHTACRKSPYRVRRQACSCQRCDAFSPYGQL
jgi:hypothetical protein